MDKIVNEIYGEKTVEIDNNNIEQMQIQECSSNQTNGLILEQDRFLPIGIFPI